MPLTPPFAIEPHTIDDIDASMASAFTAFHNDGLRQAVFPPRLADPQDPDAEMRFRRERMEKRLAEGCLAFKIVDPDKPGVIAASSTWVPPAKAGVADADDGGGSSSKKLHDAPTPDDLPKCADKAVFAEHVRLCKEAQKKVFGESKDFWYLISLFCHPDYQGKGLGAALVRWGIEQAEKDGVPVYLEATPVGKFLYAKLGFEEVQEFDLSKFTPDGRQYKVACMIKRPNGKAQ